MMRWPGEVLRMWMACCLERPRPAPFMSWCPGVRAGASRCEAFRLSSAARPWAMGCCWCPEPLSPLPGLPLRAEGWWPVTICRACLHTSDSGQALDHISGLAFDN